MKIVCDSCGAKYSIADEKVQGKVFKIRCKKCSNVIVVKGTAEAEASPSDGGGGGLGASSDAAEWYVVIDGEQVGPVTPVEIDSYFMSGKISADTYAWRDGMADWSHVADIPQFSHLTDDVAGPNEATTIADKPTYEEDEDIDATNVMQSPLGAAGSDATVQDSPGAMGYGDDPYPADPGDGGGGYGDDYGYAAEGAQDDDEGYGGFGSFDAGGGLGGLGGEIAGGGGEEEDAGGMFAAFDSGDDSDFMNFGDDGGASAAAPQSNGANGSNGTASVGSGMVGQRNENSVLFSLSSLDQVEGVAGGGGDGGGGGGSIGGGAASASGGGGGGAVTEGSGLIDIQALASAHKSMNAGGEGSGDGGIDPFQQGTMAMPALMPMGSHRSNKGLIAAAVGGGVVLLGLIGLVGYLLLSKDDKPTQPQVVEKIVVKEKVVESAEDKQRAEEEAAAADQAAKDALEGAPKKPEAEEGEAAEEEEESEKTKSKSSGRSRRRAVASAKKSNDDKDDDPPKTTTRKKKDGIDGILDTIDSKAKEQEKKAAASRSSGGKKKLSRSDVKNTISRYGGRINTCAKSHNSAGKKGTVKVKFYIRPNGRVRGASVVSSGFKGTDVGGCVRKVVASMKFPSTTASKDVPVTYPFILR